MALANHHVLARLLAELTDEIDSERIRIQDILEHFGDRSFGPIFVVLGLIVVLPPVGAIPGLPIIVAVALLLFTVQMLMGRNHVWLPRSLLQASVKREALQKTQQRSVKILSRIDRLLKERLTWATGPTARYVSAIVITIAALTMVVLEFIPFAVAAPGWAVMLIGLGLMARDGVMMVAGFVMAAVSVAMSLFFIEQAAALAGRIWDG